jgi:hypothetical protein
MHPNASLEPDWRQQFHDLNSESRSDSADVTEQEGGNASPAMNEVVPGTTIKDRGVPSQPSDSMQVNSKSVSNEID